MDSMQQQMMELCGSETLTRAREQHDRDMTALREQHEAKLLALQQKLDDQSQSLEVQVSVSLYSGMAKQIYKACIISYHSLICAI